MNSTAIAVTVISSLLSGGLGVVISTLYHRRYDRQKLRRDVLRRFAGNRHFLTGSLLADCGGREPFVALNEAFVVYADCPRVIAALKKMHEEIAQQSRLVDNIVTLIKEMAKAASVAVGDLNDAFMQRPFTPGTNT